MVIPDWNDQHVIPTVRDVPEDEQGLPINRSPFGATLQELVQYFAITPERITLIRDLMNYRDALYAAGVDDGFQWINGSFVEHVELQQWRGKDPKPNDIDIDIVTFYFPPVDPPSNLADLFDLTVTREKFNIDAYAITLGTELTTHMIHTISYWQSMWSTRRRDHMPKGFIHVELDPDNDPQARQALNEIAL
jgi:hypothetical protein